jgi:hypothetical protein
MIVFLIVMAGIAGVATYLCERVDRPHRRLEREARQGL